MKYLELTITTTHEAEELVSSKLWEFTEYGVSICDDEDVLELINKRRNTWDYLEDGVTANLGSGVTLVKCYLDLDTASTVISKIENALFEMKALSSEYINFGTLEIIKREVDGDDWIEIWRKHYRPMDMGKVVICPNWIDYEAKEGQTVVKIESNMAFGTGEHETTSSCIDMLCDYVTGKETVLDVGTGSGILGITAVKLGAKKAVMTDIDIVAVETAKRNAILNEVGDKCVITLDNLLDKDNSVGDIVVANITADILCVLSESLQSHCKKGTILILSGILREKAELVTSTYIPLGYEIIKSISKGEWVAFAMKKL
ncbi:MAG: 50S ribosomal protein L11 methyltransferase [Clostridia bacterium]|nr:50S ribosomal protein L11 methyltransferase [Clostridia bacterium]